MEFKSSSFPALSKRTCWTMINGLISKPAFLNSTSAKLSLYSPAELNPQQWGMHQVWVKQLDKISPLMCTFLTDLPIFQTEPLTQSKSIKTLSFNFLPRHEQTVNTHGAYPGNPPLPTSWPVWGAQYTEGCCHWAQWPDWPSACWGLQPQEATC